MENETHYDLFDEYNKDAEESTDITKATTKTPNTAKHTKNNSFSRILIGILASIAGALIAGAHAVKKHLTREYAVIFAAVAITVTIVLIVYISLSSGSGEGIIKHNTMPRDVATEYAEKLAVCDYEGIAQKEYISTQTLVETVNQQDFTAYYENKYAAQNEILGADPQVEINSAAVKDTGDYDKYNLSRFLKNNYDIILSDDVLDSTKTALIEITLSGNGNSMPFSYKLYLIPGDSGNRNDWKVLNSDFVDDYAESNNSGITFNGN